MLQAAPIGACLGWVFLFENSRFSGETVALLHKSVDVDFLVVIFD